MSLLELFCHVDDFCQMFVPQWEQQQLQSGSRQRRRCGQLCLSEIMTLLTHFHQMRFRDFKMYYLGYVLPHLRAEFPGLVSYNRFVELIPSALVPLCAYLQSCYGECTGISFIDSTPIAVCHNRRISQHRVFADLAQRGKNSVGWFFGFKLHLVVNDRGELLACRLTVGNVDDRRPVPKLVQRLCSILETITDQLKNISQIEHTRHRSLTNFMVNLVAGLIAYSHQPKKPSLALDLPQLEAVIPN